MYINDNNMRVKKKLNREDVIPGQIFIQFIINIRGQQRCNIYIYIINNQVLIINYLRKLAMLRITP